MKEEEIPDYNIFMMCTQLNPRALTELNPDYSFRNCRPDELELWKAFPFDSETVPAGYEHYMNQFVNETYGHNMDMFYRNTLFACTKEGKPVATCSSWKAYGKINTIHWFKTLKAFEGKGIGRALLSAVMKRYDSNDYPIYLHTQPGSFRAIKLYSDFGFQLLRGERLGTRSNDLEKCLPILEEFMPPKDYQNLITTDTPGHLIKLLEGETTDQF